MYVASVRHMEIALSISEFKHGKVTNFSLLKCLLCVSVFPESSTLLIIELQKSPSPSGTIWLRMMNNYLPKPLRSWTKESQVLRTLRNVAKVSTILFPMVVIAGSANACFQLYGTFWVHCGFGRYSNIELLLKSHWLCVHPHRTLPVTMFLFGTS